MPEMRCRHLWRLENSADIPASTLPQLCCGSLSGRRGRCWGGGVQAVQRRHLCRKRGGLGMPPLCSGHDGEDGRCGVRSLCRGPFQQCCRRRASLCGVPGGALFICRARHVVPAPHVLPSRLWAEVALTAHYCPLPRARGLYAQRRVRRMHGGHVPGHGRLHGRRMPAVAHVCRGAISGRCIGHLGRSVLGVPDWAVPVADEPPADRVCEMPCGHRGPRKRQRACTRVADQGLRPVRSWVIRRAAWQ